MRCILLRRFCIAALAGIVVLSVARASLAEDPVPLPPAVSAALHQTVEAQCSGMMWYGQAAVFNRIALMRAAAMDKDVESCGLDGRIHPADPAGAAALRAETDRMARSRVGLRLVGSAQRIVDCQR